MKILWLIVALIPAPFLFHFYEYGQHVQREDAPLLLPGTILIVAITGFLAGQIPIRRVVWINIIMVLLSLILGMFFIPDDGWFKPVGRNIAMILTGAIFLIGQLIVRSFSKPIFMKKHQ